MSLGAAVLEIAATYVLPALIAEVGQRALRQAVRRPAQPAGDCACGAAHSDAPRLHVLTATRVLSDTPGRARLHVPGLRGAPAQVAVLAARCRALPGVSRVDCSAVTGNVLV